MEGLLDNDGVWQIKEDKLEEIAIGYFGDLFSTSNPVDFSDLLLVVQPKVAYAMNEWLGCLLCFFNTFEALMEWWSPKRYLIF